MRTFSPISGSTIFGLSLIAAAIVGFTPILPEAISFPILTLLALIVIVPQLDRFLNRQNSLLFLCLCLYLFLGFFYKLLGVSGGFGTIILHMQFFFCILLMLLMPTFLSDHHRLRILMLMLLVICVNIIDNIRLCIIYPEIARSVNRAMEMTDIVGTRINIGGSSWYNGVFFFFTICFFAFLNTERKLYRFITLVCSVLAGAFLLGYCLKASVLVFTVLAAILLYFAKRAGKRTSFMVVITIVFFILYLVVDIYSDEIVDYILSNIKNRRLAIRLIALVDAGNEEAEIGVSTVEGRARLWMLSMNTWLDNPVNFLFGIGDHSPSYRVNGMGIGYHSDFFDVPARYGLIGLFLMYKILRIGLRQILFFFDKEYHLQIYLIIGVFFLFGFTKAVFTPSIGCSLFLLLPLTSCLFRKSAARK